MTPPPTLQELIEIVRQDARSDQPLDELVAAAAAAEQLEETTDALLGHFVDRCRRDGRSWTEISHALGVTKQAVHKRFAPALAAHIAAATPGPTFERFTDRARHVVAASRQAATLLCADGVGSEHLLLGLFAEPAGIAGRVLAAMNVSEHEVRAAVASRQESDARQAADQSQGPNTTHGSDTSQDPDAARGTARNPSDESDSSSGGPDFTADGKGALRDALTEALEFGHNYIGTEHLLLGLYRNRDSTAAGILLTAGASEATARAHVADMLRSL